MKNVARVTPYTASHAFIALNQESLMEVMLDDEQWIAKDDLSLMEILAEISDKAYANHRVITSLHLGSRRLTDRDLTRAMLGQVGTEFGPIRAVTQSMDQVIKSADETMERYAGLLKSDGAALVHAIRTGQSPGASLDAWLGRLADYLECIQSQRGDAELPHSMESLTSWVARLVDVRIAADWVGMADLIEYEIMTRLPR
jgi:hypothetical protein